MKNSKTILAREMPRMMGAFVGAIEEALKMDGLSGDWSFSIVIAIGTEPQFASSLESHDAVLPVARDAISLIKGDLEPAPTTTPLQDFVQQQMEPLANGVNQFLSFILDEEPAIMIILTADGATFYIADMADEDAERSLRALIRAIETGQTIQPAPKQEETIH